MTTQQKFRVLRSRAYETHDTLRDDIMDAIAQVIFNPISHGYRTREAFEAQFAQSVEQTYAVGVHSATIGLLVALRACGITSGDEVITVANSDISTTGVIRQVGAVPVLCDVLESDYTINVDLVEALITPATRAIIPVDLHGHPADVCRLREIADRHNLKIIEDAALAQGAVDYDRPVGAFADVTVFSFAPVKPLGSVGNGGMLVTSDEDIYAGLRLYTYYGHAPTKEDIPVGHQNYVDEGYNVPLDPLEAALLSVKLPHLPAWTEKRRNVVSQYADGLADTPVQLPTFRANSTPTFRSYTVLVPRRQHIYEQLRAAGVEVVLHYSPPIHRHPVYRDGLQGADKLPITERLADELISLPVTPELTEPEIDYAITTLRSLLD
ncbi:MAG: DegT/DnrJ/EryC1/StrS family aminotransferase [Chloroflexota bacterium]